MKLRMAIGMWGAAAACAVLLVVSGCGLSAAAGPAHRLYDVAISEQGADFIEVFDPEKTDWSGKGAAKWTWAPSANNGFEGLTGAWGLPTDIKLRHNANWGGDWMLVADSQGLAAVIPYPKANSKKWGLNVGGNPHSVELLPSGNVAVAASTGGWVRVYAASQGPAASAYAEYRLPAAHGVLWDPGMNVLWAVGAEQLVALEVAGTDAAPVLKESFAVTLPTKNAHDVEPVYGSPDKLWVATGSKVYQYTKSTKQFDLSYAGNESISRVGVKSISNQWNGQVVETVPDMAKKPPGPCTANNWCTATVDLFAPDATRTIPGAAIYKARILNPNYQ